MDWESLAQKDRNLCLFLRFIHLRYNVAETSRAGGNQVSWGRMKMSGRTRWGQMTPGSKVAVRSPRDTAGPDSVQLGGQLLRSP